jgi:hypothetical protein
VSVSCAGLRGRLSQRGLLSQKVGLLSQIELMKLVRGRKSNAVLLRDVLLVERRVLVLVVLIQPIDGHGGARQARRLRLRRRSSIVDGRRQGESTLRG